MPFNVYNLCIYLYNCTTVRCSINIFNKKNNTRKVHRRQSHHLLRSHRLLHQSHRVWPLEDPLIHLRVGGRESHLIQLNNKILRDATLS